MSDPVDLELSADEMRTLGYHVIDMLVEHHTTLGKKPATTLKRRHQLEEALREEPPDKGSDPFQVLASVERDVLANIMYCNHPRHFA